MTASHGGRRVIDQRALDILVGTIALVYALYVLMLGKMFSPAVAPDWYRDIGILWNDADYVIGHGSYRPGLFFPPSCYILVKLFGLIGHGVAFRIYLILQVAALGAAIWAWACYAGIARSPYRALIVLTAVLACSPYVHIQLAMHNPNAEAFALVSLALLWSRSTALSAGCYAFSLAIKPYSSVFVLPWMAWNGERRWCLAAIAWLFAFFVILPVAWFGVAEAVDLHRQWLASLLWASDNSSPDQSSLRGGLAALLGSAVTDPSIRWMSVALQLAWLGALGAFFVATPLRRGPPVALVAASEAAAILLIGLPLGSHQQPSRMVVLLAAALVMSTRIFDDQQPLSVRVGLATILLAIGLLAGLIPIGPVYFLAMLPVCLLALFGLGVVRTTVMAGAGKSAMAMP
jgi:hypothetical protein